jgi:hypothetical protein
MGCTCNLVGGIKSFDGDCVEPLDFAARVVFNSIQFISVHLIKKGVVTHRI